MKKISFLGIVSLVILGSFFSCNPKDDKGPNIFFSTDVETTQNWVLQEYYTLPKATASDNVDGDLTSSITIANDLIFYELRSDSIAGQTIYRCKNKIKNGVKGYVGKTGSYVITYSATDKAGNTGSNSLRVNVLNSLNDWSVNSNNEKINYLIKRDYISGDQQRIGGVFDENGQHDTYGYTGVYGDGKSVVTTLSPDKSVNYKLKISKIANISSLGLSINFNRYSRVINFDDYETPKALKELDDSETENVFVETEFIYVINQIQSGINEYNPENNTFTITYQIERWKLDDFGTKVTSDGRKWSQDRKCIYSESFMPE